MLLSGCVPPAPQTVKIGLVAPFEGHYRDIGYDAIYAARLAVREINAAGGVAGLKLVLVAYDDRADPHMAQNAARNLVIDPEVVAVIGHYRPESTAAAASVYTQAHMPWIVIGGWVTDTQACTWHLRPSPDQMAAAMVAVDGENVQSTGLWGTGPLHNALEEHLAAQEHAPVPALVPTSASPSCIFSTLSPLESAERLEVWRDAGWQGMLVGTPDLMSHAFSAIAEEASGQTYAVTPYPLPQHMPDLPTWCESYRAVGPHVPPPGLYALPTYEAVYLLTQALDTAALETHTPTRAAMVDAVAETQRTGLLGHITWDAQGFWDTSPLYLYRWHNGMWETYVTLHQQP